MKTEEALLWFFGLLLFARKNRLSFAELRSLARSVGFPETQLDTAAAVAIAESGGYPMAVGDVRFGFSIGLWQINLRAHPQYSAFGLYDPTANAKAAFKVSSGGTDWHPWSTFNDGTYKKYLPKTAPSPPANA